MVLATTGGGQDVARDPEVLVGIFVVGGALAVLSFIVFRIVISIGTELESPEPVQALRRALFEENR